ncbi:MAG TPA: glycogen/starch/alpha-glucan phosphorylase [Stellaceae bacterium]|nr:glycogen/starch/alpha-glucan phosphorylase [Stellaceae bacterium]
MTSDGNEDGVPEREVGGERLQWRSAAPEGPTTEEDIEHFKHTVLNRLTLAVGKDPSSATDRDWFVATTLALRDRVIHRWLQVDRENLAHGRKRIYYLSFEFLIGRLLNDVAGNLQMTDVVHRALGDLGVNFDRVRYAEPDAALGNGGLGRLAACFLESMASLGVPAYGYGIRYDHGLFRQIINDGWQQEYPEEWLSFRNPWEFERSEVTYDIGYGGWVETVATRAGHRRFVWHPQETIEAVAYDTPVVGWRAAHVNPLRLWSARAVDPIRLEVFNRGDHVEALSEHMRAEAISKILYPSDETRAGRELRLRQEYFFVSASLQDLVERHRRAYGSLHTLPEQAAIQLNDTHPSIAIAELMRILVDLHNIAWDDAWQITVDTCRYTNHTLLPEALESWPVSLFERVLPRHLQIIYLINARHLEALERTHALDADRIAAISLIDERDGQRVKMGHLAFLGCGRTNGVSAIHTELMRQTVFHDLATLYPNRIVNVTNGITFRRWLYQANPGLTRLLSAACGEDIRDNPAAIARLADMADDAALHQRLRLVKRINKLPLARLIGDQLGLVVDPEAIFDVHIKRIHEYKRQLLNLLETVALYNAMRAEPTRDWVPRVKIFAGKAAASYAAAKLIVKLAHDIAAVINRDPAVRGLLRVAFLANYNVSLAETIIPAADLSEQISTAGMEASGTGNMKLALNGALTIGTLDGANIEIRDRVGADNVFAFGLNADEVAELRRAGFDGGRTITPSPALSEVLEMIEGGVFSPGEPDRFALLTDRLRGSDQYMLVADFDSYWQAQRNVDERWRKPDDWAAACVRNIAGMGWFSADRAINEYAGSVWRARFH